MYMLPNKWKNSEKNSNLKTRMKGKNSFFIAGRGVGKY